MNPVVQQLLREAESLSGTPVQVIHDVDLPISARIQFARNGASHHVLVVKPGPAADYAVANQLGFLTRLFSLPAEDRCDFLITPQAQHHAATLVDELLLPQRTLGAAGRAAISQSILQWTLAGARSNPIGMRIDQAIFRDMPALRGSFMAGVREQNNLNLTGLRNLQQNFRVPAALAGPAAAYSLFVDRLLRGCRGERLAATIGAAIGLREPRDGGQRDAQGIRSRAPDGADPWPSSRRDATTGWPRCPQVAPVRSAD